MMKKILLATALAGLVAGPALAQQSAAPGQRMQEQGSVKGTTGASGYAPGQQMHKRGSVKHTAGASGYAPGHAKSTVGMSRGDLSTQSRTSTRSTTGTKTTTGVSRD
jgi:hypothetical protein